MADQELLGLLPLVLLCHKCLLARVEVPHHGQQGSVRTSRRAWRTRRLVIEAGLYRSGRMDGAPRAEAGGEASGPEEGQRCWGESRARSAARNA